MSRRITLAIALGITAPALSANAADIVVDTIADSGSGSLRQAIADANPGDVIVFDIDDPAPVITLLTALPAIDGDLTFRNERVVQVEIERGAVATPWEFNGGTIDPTGLTFTEAGGPTTSADILTSTATNLFGDGVLDGSLTTPGTLSPGDSTRVGRIGTFEVTGDLDATNSTIDLDIDTLAGNEFDRVIVGGDLDVTDARLNPRFLGEDYEIGDQFIVLQAGTITGTIANAPGEMYDLPNNPFLEAVQDGTLAPNQLGFVVQDNGESFATVIIGCNQSRAAMLLDQLRAEAAPLASVTNLRDASSSELTNAVNQLSGSIYASLVGAEINHVQVNLESVRDRVALQPLGPRQAVDTIVWARGYGASGEVGHDDCRTLGYRQEFGGLELGGGLRGTNGWSAYGFGHLSGAEIRSEDVDQNAQVESYRAGGLLEYLGETFYALGSGGGGTQSYDVRRSLSQFAGSGFTESEFDGTTQFGYVELGKVFGNRTTTWVPHLGLHATRVETDGVRETGDADFALSHAGVDGESLRSVMALSLNQVGQTPMGLARTRIRFGWMHEYLDESETLVSQIARTTIPDNTIVDRGVQAGSDWAIARVQLDIGAFFGAQFTTSYLGQYNSRSSLSTGLAGLEWVY